MIAEYVMTTEDEEYEAMDLFRHSTELQFHVIYLYVYFNERRKINKLLSNFNTTANSN